MRFSPSQVVFALALIDSARGSHKPRGDLDILAGQHVIYSWDYTLPGPPEELYNLTRDGLVGGVLLYDVHVNKDTPAALAKLQAAYKASPAYRLLRKQSGKETSLLIMTNEEGGTVFNGVIDGGPPLSAKEIGASPNPSVTGWQAGVQAAKALKSYNFNMDLAPVLGVYRQEDNFLDAGNRSYGNTPQKVIDAAMPFIKAQRARNILVSAKHFPGLGAAARDQNTDIAPVALDVTLEDLENIDLRPFTAAICAGVDLIMPSWAVYPAVDSSLPAGLSPKWMKGILRDRLGFRGVTITEAMEAGAILLYGDVEKRARIAVAAGNDLILASQLNVTEGVAIRNALVAGLRSGRLNRDEFDRATDRIILLAAISLWY
ncbi:hypothetical protein LMH87_002632 [Akanthomyces muscarius]|uniref:Glycoside hydrolase family 3 N-terminal domain-containing protein n=1 Tax=Akanthomyces muscarius TaxID=2231603 RepID=A0A9W8UIR3_AKAMU|nr:hypothetical protein LMH87_002632 [Akanthomyces muscarius]KAJ4148150.1 hypothetical protein LMH87_002632 [Akanthomyces muscarius]